MLTLNSSPTSNTLNCQVKLLSADGTQATLDAGGAANLSVSFNQVALITPGHAPVVRTMAGGANVRSNPGDIAIIRAGGIANTVVVSWAPRNGNAQTATFQ